MKTFIRISAAVSFIYLALALSACAEIKPGASTGANTNRPLATPRITSDRPKIIAFGDSLTAGFGLSEKESYPYLLQEKLKADGFDYEVINAGVSGDTSLAGLERSDWVLGQEKAEILILELGANDLLRRMPVDKMRSNLDKIIVKAKAKGMKVLLCGMLSPPTQGSDYGREFTQVFPDLATKHKVEFLPFLLENVALQKDLNQADGIHPNPAGERIMTENIYRALKPMIEKASPRS